MIAIPSFLRVAGSLLALTVGAALHGIAQAETATVLPAVTVSDSQTEIAQALGQTTELSRRDLEANGKADVNGALRGIPGVNLNQANQSTTTGASLRGASGGLGLFTLDGVPLFSSFVAFFPLSHFPQDSLDRVGVTRGAGGERRGSRTLGGAIHLQSRRMDDGKAFLHVEGGSFDTVRTAVGGGLKNALGNWTVVGGRADIFNGISQAGPQNGGTEGDNFHLSNGLLRWDKDFDRGSLDSSLYFVRSRENMDGPGVLPNRKLGWKDDPKGLLIEETWVAQTRGRYAVTDNWESTLQIGYTKDRQVGAIGTVPGRPRFSMDMTSQLWLSRWENAHHVSLSSAAKDALNIVWGVEAQQQHGDSPINSIVSTNTVISPLVRAEAEINNWLANAEARFDHHDIYGDHTVFNLGGGRRLTPDMTLWARGGTGYRPPAVNERMHPLFGSTTLKPERNAGGEVGWRWQPSDKTEVSLSGYYQHYQNLINLQYNATTGSVRALNVNDANVWGAEAQTRHAWNDVWSSGLSYAFMDARDSSTDLKIPGRPTHQGQFWNEFHIIEPVTWRVELTFRDSSWFDGANLMGTRPAPRLNTQINYQATPKLKLYVRGENMNDERAPELPGFGFAGAAVYGGFNIEL